MTNDGKNTKSRAETLVTRDEARVAGRRLREELDALNATRTDDVEVLRKQLATLRADNARLRETIERIKNEK